MRVTPYNSFRSKYSKTTKCFAWARLEVKNQKQSGVNQSNKEANSSKQEGCSQKNESEPKKVLKLSFLSLFLI